MTKKTSSGWAIDKKVNLGQFISGLILIMAMLAGLRDASERSAITEYKVNEMDARMQKLEDSAVLNALTLKRITTILEEREGK